MLTDDRVPIRLTNQPNGWGVKTEVDGHELPSVRALQLAVTADHVPELTIDMRVMGPLLLTLSAKVTIHLHVMPGARIVDISTHEDPEGTRTMMVTYPGKTHDEN